MKRLLTLMIFLISISAFSQPNEKMKERIKAQKIAFITEWIKLTPEEAQKFWPIYNAYEESLEKIRSEDLNTIRTQMMTNPGMSDAEADVLLEKFTKAENDTHDAKIKLIEDLKKILPSYKIIKLKASENAFNKRLLERLKEFRGKQGNRN
ncbi:hypothetical protein [Psychroserpens sp.]|uniref:hypothetical protein n=1 Tax=Psychroserpens sp. TaxID=2020870 RepID=UPI002B265F04|nr:hypothetical protein [Psychroserpens sp.]